MKESTLDLSLNLDLSKPDDARIFIDKFKYVLSKSMDGNDATFVRTSSGKEIYISNLSDEEAVMVAHCLFDLIEEDQPPKSLMH